MLQDAGNDLQDFTASHKVVIFSVRRNNLHCLYYIANTYTSEVELSLCFTKYRAVKANGVAGGMSRGEWSPSTAGGITRVGGILETEWVSPRASLKLYG